MLGFFNGVGLCTRKLNTFRFLSSIIKTVWKSDFFVVFKTKSSEWAHILPIISSSGCFAGVRFANLQFLTLWSHNFCALLYPRLCSKGRNEVDDPQIPGRHSEITNAPILYLSSDGKSDFYFQEPDNWVVPSFPLPYKRRCREIHIPHVLSASQIPL